MSFQIVDDRPYYSPTRARTSLGAFGILPLVYAIGAGAIAAGVLVAEWLSKDDWSAGQYNSYMLQMYQTILAWDTLGWQKGCWTDAGRRARWKIFMNAFGAHYAAHGNISSNFLDDSEERPARDFMRQLAAWGDELNAACGANIPSNLPGPAPGEPGSNDAPKPTEPIDYIKWGVYLVGGVLALQLIGAFRTATAPTRSY